MNSIELIRTYVNDKSKYKPRKHGKPYSQLVHAPEYYSGRGAIRNDLNSTILEMLYDGVLAEYGAESAKNFVQLVYEIEKLSATAFLNHFHSFVGNGCIRASVRAHQPADDIDIGKDERTQETIGAISLLGAMFGDSDRDETESIRHAFLNKHRKECELDQDRGHYCINDRFTYFRRR